MTLQLSFTVNPGRKHTSGGVGELPLLENLPAVCV